MSHVLTRKRGSQWMRIFSKHQLPPPPISQAFSKLILEHPDTTLMLLDPLPTPNPSNNTAELKLTLLAVTTTNKKKKIMITEKVTLNAMVHLLLECKLMSQNSLFIVHIHETTSPGKRRQWMRSMASRPTASISPVRNAILR